MLSSVLFSIYRLFLALAYLHAVSAPNLVLCIMHLYTHSANVNVS